MLSAHSVPYLFGRLQLLDLDLETLGYRAVYLGLNDCLSLVVVVPKPFGLLDPFLVLLSYGVVFGKGGDGCGLARLSFDMPHHTSGGREHCKRVALPHNPVGTVASEFGDSEIFSVGGGHVGLCGAHNL